MSRWFIEKSGTGIEKSGTGIEKSGTGIEKSGTGIEKSGTGIEKSGTGIRHALLCLSITAISFVSQVSASSELSPAGAMTVVVENETVAVSWIIDGSVFSGVASINGTFASLSLTEIGLAHQKLNATAYSKKVIGAGSGTEVVGAGSGSEVVGAGSGSEVVGAGSGSEVVGAGSGSEVVGAGSGTDFYDQSTEIFVVGSGSGADSIVITLPEGTDMQMEISLACNSADISIFDSNFAEVIAFKNIAVSGASDFCQASNRDGADSRGSKNPGQRGSHR